MLWSTLTVFQNFHILYRPSFWFSSVQFSRSVMSNSATPWTAACQVSLSIANSWSPPKPMSIESVMPSNHLILCRPLLLLPSIFPSIRVFSNESALCIWWPKYWSFSFNISPSNEHLRLISFRMDWLDLLAVQGTLKSLLQHHSSKASILWHLAGLVISMLTCKKPFCTFLWTFNSPVSQICLQWVPDNKWVALGHIAIRWQDSGCHDVPSVTVTSPANGRGLSLHLD